MLQIRPSIDLVVDCPDCGTSLVFGALRFAGIPVFAECRCSSCHGQYWLDLPVGHALLHPTIINAKTGAVHFDGLEWYPKMLRRCVQLRATPVTPPITVRKAPPRSDSLVVINCIDSLYGHCLLKLLSSLHYLDWPNVDVVAIVPRLLAWIVPVSLHAVIEVDIELAQSQAWIDGLDETINEIMAGYKTVYLAEAISQPDLSEVDLSVLGAEFRSKPFWDSAGGRRQVTIVTREDRLWIGSERILPAIRRRPYLAGGTLQGLLVRLQNRRFAQFARGLRRLMPDVRIVVVGLGCTGRFPAYVLDLRRTEMTSEAERQWCQEYAQSRVVVGMHGSNMLLPSALAGSVVEFLPDGKLRNVTQDLIIRNNSEPKLCLFRYRILPLATSPAQVVKLVASIFKDAELHFRNVVENRSPAARSQRTRAIAWRTLSEDASPRRPVPAKPRSRSNLWHYVCR